jgi:hypothetical protein
VRQKRCRSGIPTAGQAAAAQTILSLTGALPYCRRAVQCSAVQHTPLDGRWHAQALPPVLMAAKGLVGTWLHRCCKGTEAVQQVHFRPTDHFQALLPLLLRLRLLLLHRCCCCCGWRVLLLARDHSLVLGWTTTLACTTSTGPAACRRWSLDDPCDSKSCIGPCAAHLRDASGDAHQTCMHAGAGVDQGSTVVRHWTYHLRPPARLECACASLQNVVTRALACSRG